jgi:predicted amidohydrolase
MTRSIRVAAVQLRAHDRSEFGRVQDALVDAAAEAATGAELVVLPEGTFPAYVLGDAGESGDEAAVAAALERLGNLARESSTVIVAGAAVRNGRVLRNAAIVIDRNGAPAGRADKLFLWHFDRRWFEAGAHLAPIRTGVGTLGVMVCADGRLPTIARALVDGGAEMLVMPTAWVTSGRDPNALENVQADLLARVRAYENAVPFVAANKCGDEYGIAAYCGKSQIVDAAGGIAAIASERRPETIKAVVVTGEGRPHRCAVADPAPRGSALTAPVRIAFTAEPLSAAGERALGLIDAGFAIVPGDRERLGALDRVLPLASVGDETALDPGGLVNYRRAGYRLIVWSAKTSSEWTQRVARARALELRLYVVVIDAAAGRAYAIDPDGAVIAGTYDGYRIASFVLDPAKAEQTVVAPGTDVLEGLERVAAIARREGARIS